MHQASPSSSRDWFTEAMETIKVYFLKDAGDGEFWIRKIRHYKAILDDVTRDEMKSIVRYLAQTRKFPTFPAAADLLEIKHQLRNAAYPGADPAEERERQAKEAQRQPPDWIDRQFKELIGPLSPERRAFIAAIPMGSWNKLGALCVFKSLEAGEHPKSAEWRELG